MITKEKSAITKAKSQDAGLKNTTPPKSVAKNYQGIDSLRRRLLAGILPAVLLPLVIGGVVGYKMTESRARNQVIEKLEADALLGSKTINTFIRDSYNLVGLVAANPSVIQLMQQGGERAQEQRLVQQPILVLEKEFTTSKLLTIDNNLNNYLEEIVKSTAAEAILLTESHGFNIAYSNPISDFVQSDEEWWQDAQTEGRALEEPDEFDEPGELESSESSESSNESEIINIMAFSQAVTDSQTSKFLGVVKVDIPLGKLNSDLATYLHGANRTYIPKFQIFESDSALILSNIEDTLQNSENQESNFEDVKILGGKPIIQVAKILVEVAENSLSLAEAKQSIMEQPGVSQVRLHQEMIFSVNSIVASFRCQDKIYSISTVPETDFVSTSSVDYDVVASAARNLLAVFTLTTIALGVIASSLIIFLTKRFAKPLEELSEKTQQVRELLQEQKILAEEQRQEKENLEEAIYNLIEEVSNATEGDLTVRAKLDSLELSTVADLFNAIIDNLQEIAIQTKKSTHQVGSSLKQNEQAIRFLASKATAEARETRATVSSIELMSQSIQEVAENANQAEKIADETYSTVLNSTNDMNSTVDSILELRTTVGETAKKMKRLGESTQKIAQAVSFIEEIALKTNVLAINASVEAGRAGEYGQGFTIVAEQVGTLAEQSAAATKKIANIVSTIQAETQEVSLAMESGTVQVVDTTRLVESTKDNLRLVLEKSQRINQLMHSISQKTISQAYTSQSVTNLMEKIAQLSENTSKSSQAVAQSIAETAQVAENLESTVAQFKVAE
ncbi:methyl-accepting chemotaxis protein [Pleurocapsa sp. PCC 7319]|uniref:methyl-accepting chemotaxis protein n=1 Tax=Pleurocapsa sp. PCC 7319 TaxID=118161 RepID=UPI00034BCE46|nr:methyl-accepting chemotaxis protein [Pleurocapsa sp. PCC 7319]